MKKEAISLLVALSLAVALLLGGASYKRYQANSQRVVSVDIFSLSHSDVTLGPQLLKTWTNIEAERVFAAWSINSNLTGCRDGLTSPGNFVLRVMKRDGTLFERQFALDGTIEPLCEKLTPQSRDFYLRLLANTPPVMEQRRRAMDYRAAQQTHPLNHH